MDLMTQTTPSPPEHDITADRQFVPWLAQQQISIACTTYQTSRLMLLGVNPDKGSISGFERIFDRAMGLYTTSDRLYLSSKYQIWQFENALSPQQSHNGYDKLYIPKIGYTTGDLDIHDIAEVERWIDGTPWQQSLPVPFVFISTLLNCVATVSDRYSCQPLWKPSFISKVINEDRCHLNGLAVVKGQPRYVTAISRSDVIDGWRDRRQDGGIIMDMITNEVVASGFSMPHSPRWYRDQLWVLNSGRGELGYVDLQTGTFEPIAFCPGYLRGLAFWGDFALVGLSQPRNGDKTFSGLPLDDLLKSKDANSRCGLMVINLKSGAIEHWLRFEGVITELYDVQILPQVQRPMALGFQSEEIAQCISLGPLTQSHQPETPSLPKASTPSPPLCQEDKVKLRQQRHQVAQQWLKLPLEQLEANYVGELGQVHRTLHSHELRYETLTATEQAFVDQLMTGLITPTNTLQSFLALMLYRAAYQLPTRWFESITVPSWLVNDYLAYMQAVPLFFQAVGEAECYAGYLRDWFTFIHRKIHQNLSSSFWHSVAGVVAEAVFAPIYFNDLNLKETFVKWAAITEFSLEKQGFDLHQFCPPRPAHRHRIRLGILNQSYSPCSETFSTLPFYEYLDRQQFEIILYAESSQDHPLEKYCRSRCDQFVQLPEDLQTSVQTIRKDDLDILLFGINISVGNKLTARLAMHRLARVQISSNSSPVTSGINNIDYYISGSLATPVETFQSQYSEKLVNLDGPSHCYRFPPSAKQPIAEPFDRRDLNIAEDAVVFISGANFFKVIPEQRITWTQILAAVPNSVLLLYPFSAWSNHYPVSAFRNHMTALFAEYEIDPSRLIIQGPIPNREQVKQLLQIADVYLDAYPFTGVTSILDPLEVGLPLVVQTGNSLRSRQGPALLEAIDLTDLIASDECRYLEIATNLGQQPDLRQQYRTLIQQKMAANPSFLDSQAYGAQVGPLFKQLQLLSPFETAIGEGQPSPPSEIQRTRVIAFSLWGANPKYTTGAIKNADLASTIYPGWICRFYIDQTVPPEIANELKAHPQAEVVQLDGDRGWQMSFARFYPAADPDVGVLICRDTDSRLNLREKAAVDAWLQSSQKYHVMRDHPRHNVPMLAGMWGVKGNVLDMAILVEQHLVDQADLGLRYGIDQHFLATKIYPKTQSSCLIHDEIFQKNPFPNPRNNLEYVGQVFLEDESTLQPIDELLQQHLLQEDSLSLHVFEPSSNTATSASTSVAPQSVQALFERSRQLKKEDKLSEAEACLREVIDLYPNHWGAHNNLGTLLQNQEKIEEAKACYQQALQLNVNFAEAHSNLASIWQLNEDLERAKTGFHRALQLKPDYVPAHLNLANIYKQQRRMAAAIKHFQKVVVAEPKHTEAHFNLGQIFEYQGKSEEALACYQKALKGESDAQYIWFFISLVKLKLCHWQDYDAQVQRLQHMIAQSFSAKYSPNPFVLSTFNFPLDLHQAAARNQAKNAQRSVKSSLSFVHHRKATPKIRIGYISPDLRDHAVGRLIVDLFPYHNRDQYEIYAYTTVDVEDHITQQIQAGCDAFEDLSPLSTEQSAQHIYDDGIQILVDLAGYTIGNVASVLSLQPAPIQAQWLGYPDTMGAEFIQYAIADEWLITPEIAQSYTEKIAYLPHAFVGSPLMISNRSMTRTEFGLPEFAFVFCCFNSHYKITPDLFDVWMRILQQVPESVLWLLEGADTVMGNLCAEAQQRGVNPDRLIFASKIAHEDYLARYALADLYLDTFVYNAGSTAVATCWSGLPMLTFPGLTNASRMGASICAAAGLESLICESVADYEQRAVHLATHPQALQKIRNRLKQQLLCADTYPRLFQVEKFVVSLEAAFHQMWQNYLNNSPLHDL